MDAFCSSHAFKNIFPCSVCTAQFLSDGKGGGVIQGTASEALIVSLLAARQRARTRWMAGQADGDDAVAVASTGDDEDADSHADGGEGAAHRGWGLLR